MMQEKEKETEKENTPHGLLLARNLAEETEKELEEDDGIREFQKQLQEADCPGALHDMSLGIVPANLWCVTKEGRERLDPRRKCHICRVPRAEDKNRGGLEWSGA